MSTKTCRTMQGIAFGLFALALLLCIASIFLQTPLKRSVGLSEQGLAIHSIPYRSILTCVIYTILALVWLLAAQGRTSHSTIMTTGIVLAILFCAFDAILLSTGSALITMFVSRQGVDAIASNAALESVLSSIRVLIVPAKILMFLSMGGMMGKDLSQESSESI